MAGEDAEEGYSCGAGELRDCELEGWQRQDARVACKRGFGKGEQRLGSVFGRDDRRMELRSWGTTHLEAEEVVDTLTA